MFVIVGGVDRGGGEVFEFHEARETCITVD